MAAPLSASPARNGPPLPRPVPAVTPLPRETSVATLVDPCETEKDWLMRTFSKITTAVALTFSTATAISIPAPADARHRHHYYSRSHYYYRACRRSSGTTGLVAGGVGGALGGRSVLGHGVLGTVGGAVGGALAGRAIDRTITAPRRCRYYR